MRSWPVAFGILAFILLASPSIRAQAPPRPPPAVEPSEEGPVTAGAMTEDAARAKRLFDAQRWGEAALWLERVASGATGDDDGNRQIAQFRLAIALYRLKLYHPSYAIFSAIADDPAHLRFDDTLLWLAKLAIELPEPAGIVERIGKYAPEALARFDNPAQRSLFWHLNYLLGRYHYRKRGYEEAIRLFGKVGDKSEHFIRALFFTGISHVQLRRSEPAVEAFQRIIEAIDRAGERFEEAGRMRDLAFLSIARIQYSTSIKLAENDIPWIDGRKIDAAVKYYHRIDPEGEHWLDSMYEQSWAYFMAGDYAHALGNLFTLEAPYFPDSFYPEADLLKAVIAFKLCRYDDAATIVARMSKKYDPIQRELEIVLDRFQDADGDQKVIDFVNELRAGKAILFPAARPVLEHALFDRQLLRNLDYVRALGEEELRFRKAPASLRSSPLGRSILDALDLARDLAVRRAGTLALERYDNALDELGKHLRTASGMFARATSLAERPPGKLAARGEITIDGVHADDEHVIWPLRGEIWRDELGSYRQVVVSRCGK